MSTLAPRLVAVILAGLLGLTIATAAPTPLSTFVHPDTVPASSWSAQWIGATPPTPAAAATTPEAAPKNQWTAFRKEFDLKKKPENALARIAVDSKYWLWINGQLVVREGGLKRGPTRMALSLARARRASPVHDKLIRC